MSNEPEGEEQISSGALACILIGLAVMLIIGGLAWRYLLHKYLGWYY